MKRCALGCLAAVLLAAGPPDDATRKDLERMQGDWAAVTMIVDGAKSADDEVEGEFQTIQGNQYTFFLFKKPVVKGTYKLDATKQPRAIDNVTTEGLGKGMTMQGIYAFDGDRLKTCFAFPGKERPKDFTSEKGSGHFLMIWEREKK